MASFFLGLITLIICNMIIKTLKLKFLLWGPTIGLVLSVIFPLMMLLKFPFWFCLLSFSILIQQELGLGTSLVDTSHIQRKYGATVNFVCTILFMISIGIAVYNFFFK